MENNRHSEIEHTFGCAFAQRGALCDCYIGDIPPRLHDFLAAELARAMSRGFDYSVLVEGLQPDDEEES